MNGLLCRAITATAVMTACALPAASAEGWTATSSTAIAVTGDLEIAGDTLIFGNGLRLPLTPIGERQGRWNPVGKVTSGKVYKLTPPSDPALLNGNTLCGMPEPVTYVVLAQSSPRSLGLTVFTGAQPPQGFRRSVLCRLFL